MILPQIPNLEIKHITKEILLVHQIKTPYYFSCCDGLIVLPKNGRSKLAIALDLNIEPNLIDEINYHYGPFSNYVCTHGHMDHMAHVHHWEDLGAIIHAPIPENTYLLNLKNFYLGFGFNEKLDFSLITKFAENNKYHPCKAVRPFIPGAKLTFENFTIETISFKGHSKAHVGFLLPSEKILHISCLGFDQPKPRIDGFGPWYGFNECSIDQYLKDIDSAESIFLEDAQYLTSSHAYIVKHPDSSPFSYMRNKIEKNQSIVDHAILTLKKTNNYKIEINDFLQMDLFFPKKKLKGFIAEMYSYWESIIIYKHIERSKYLKNY